MSNYLQVASGLDVTSVLLDLHRQPHLWNKNPCRLFRGGPHCESSDIILRYKDERPAYENMERWNEHGDEHIPLWYQSIDYLPGVRPLVYWLAQRVGAEMIGAVLIYKLEPGKEIESHVDMGWHAHYYEKFNVCLQSNPKAAFVFDDGAFVQRPGDVHSFNNLVPHKVVNQGECDHIVLVVCLRLDRGERVPWAPDGWSIEKQVEGELSCR
jgi:uncharacterized cupin superfamily protein